MRFHSHRMAIGRMNGMEYSLGKNSGKQLAVEKVDLIQVEDGIDVAKSQQREIVFQSQAKLFRARNQVITAIYLGKDTRMIRTQD